MKVHDLKTDVEYLDEITTYEKPFECRLNDRDFDEGDILVLREYDRGTDKYGHKAVVCLVTYILNDHFPGVTKGYVIMGIKLLHKKERSLTSA